MATGSSKGSGFLCTVSATATGGNGGIGVGLGYKGGDGASLTNAATASFVGDMATVAVVQVGGNGGRGLQQGTAGDGGDSILTNSITGGATTSFTLSQTAIGGNGGTSNDGIQPNGVGGDASSNLTFVNSLGGDTFGTSNAIGGNSGGQDFGTVEGQGFDGGTAHAQIDLTSVGVVSATVSVTGGDGGSTAAVGPFGAGDGADVSIDSNSINATSTGGNSIILNARATGGRGGSTEFSGLPGRGGEATVSVSKVASNSSFTLQSTATGGDGGGDQFGLNAAGGSGGLASAESNVLNTGGSVLATADASGGQGGSCGKGGRGGDGGKATSDAQGVTTGDFSVEVSSSAQAGDAGLGNVIGGSGSYVFNGANGGDALATSSGSNNGSSSVAVTASAVSGAGSEGVFGGSDGIGGNATAISAASGLGEVTSNATAQATFLLPGGPVVHPVYGGAALAHASATGQSGSATATAQTGGRAFANVYASATAPVGSSVDVESRTQIEGLAPGLAMAAGLQSAAFVTALPSGGAPATASIVQGAAYPQNGSGISETFSSEVRLSINLAQIPNLSDLQIHFQNAAATGNGFDLLTFQIFREGVVIEDDVFKDLAAATAFFTNHDLDFGAANSGVTGPLDLRFVFNLTASHSSDGFSIAYSADVPEPATMVLFLGGVIFFIFLGCRTRSAKNT